MAVKWAPEPGGSPDHSLWSNWSPGQCTPE